VKALSVLAAGHSGQAMGLEAAWWGLEGLARGHKAEPSWSEILTSSWKFPKLTKLQN